jgi:N utilization substance protein B
MMEVAKPSARPFKPANKRGASRLAAVQALYQMDVGGTPIEDVLAEFETFRLGGELDGVRYRDADPAFFRDIVSGVVRDQRDLDPLIHETLLSSWPLARIDVTLRSILRAASHELKSRPDVPAKVVISEYVEIARAFFEGEEPGITNGVLDSLARKLRGSELSPPAGPN